MAALVLYDLPILFLIFFPYAEAKEMAAQAKVPLHNTMPARAKRNLSDDYGAESSHLDVMRESLQQAQIRLEEKRREANRPQDLNVRIYDDYILVHMCKMFDKVQASYHSTSDTCLNPVGMVIFVCI